MADVRKIAKRVAIAVYAGAAAALPVSIRHHWISAADGQDIGVIVAAVAAAWHGGITLADKFPKAPSPPPATPLAAVPAGLGGAVPAVGLLPDGGDQLTPDTGNWP